MMMSDEKKKRSAKFTSGGQKPQNPSQSSKTLFIKGTLHTFKMGGIDAADVALEYVPGRGLIA